MAATIVTKNSSTAGAVPTASDLVQGELAVNVTDKALYTENASGTVVKLNAPSIVDNGNATAITIDSSENVGIGTSSPSKKFVVSDAAASGFEVSPNDSGLGYNRLLNYNRSTSQYMPVRYEGSTHTWYASTAGTTRAMDIDSSGNVGIGTSSPTKKLEVGSLGAFRLQTGSVTMDCTPTPGGIDGFVWNVSAGYYDWSIGGSSKMRIDSSGNLLVGTTSQVNVSKFSFVGDFYNANGMSLKTTNDGTGAQFIGFLNSSGTVIGGVNRVTTTNAVVYNTTSDQRLKSNIEDALPVLDKLMQVQVRQYDWTEGDLHQDYGFIAQELEPVLSGVVTKGKTEEDIWQLDYSRLTPHLVKAIQEQQAIIEGLTARITALESK